jgi:nucleotide-binding universal stress UspA family protein
MKTILVPTEHNDAMVSTLETALLFARKFDSYVEGFALRAALSNLVDMESGSPMLADSFAQQFQDAEKEARGIFEGFMANHGVPRAAATRNALSFGWRENAPEGDHFVGSHGRVFDVTVLGRPGPHRKGAGMALLEVALFESGHPILIAPPAPLQRIGTNVLIAWNCSTEQARTTTYALPVLRQAQRVTVLTVEGGSAVAGPPSDDLCGYLASHGIAAQQKLVGLEGRSTGEAILATARSLDCDLLVKGAYTQSRLRQMFFGGATRHILTNATLPVLMAH